MLMFRPANVVITPTPQSTATRPAPPIDPKRWWILATVVAAQFMFVVDAFIVNVAIPSIRANLNIGAAEIEAVIAIYQIAYATVVITGGRLGDIVGRRRMFLIGLLGFTLASLACGFANSGTTLILGRLAQGAAAALMVPQVLATIHVLFPDAARGKAFAIFGIVLGLGGCTGFLLGGWLVSADIAGLGWRSVFFVNLPVGMVIVVAASRLMPTTTVHPGTRLDLSGAATLFAGLLCLIGPLLFGHDTGWASWVWGIMAAGIVILAGFFQLERRVQHRGGLPLIDLQLLADRLFLQRIAALFTFHLGNTSFYLVLTLFLQNGLGFSPLAGGLAVVPLGVAFVVASGGRSPQGMTRLLVGCAIQLLGLVGLAGVIAIDPHPTLAMLVAPLTVFGYGQGLVMAPLFNLVLSSVASNRAGAASGMLSTTQQIAAAVGISLAGLIYTTGLAEGGHRVAVLAALIALSTTILATALLLCRKPIPTATMPKA